MEVESNRNLHRAVSFSGGGAISDLALEVVMDYVDDPWDRDAISLVCKKWNEIDARTRKHVTIALCYSATPHRLRRRFPRLESLKLKGKPRASMFNNIIPDDWGGYAQPWVNGIVSDVDADAFSCLNLIHFRRMIVKDEDIEVLVRSRGSKLKCLKLDKCTGFSTGGWACSYCQVLQVETLERATKTVKSGSNSQDFDEEDPPILKPYWDCKNLSKNRCWE